MYKWALTAVLVAAIFSNFWGCSQSKRQFLPAEPSTVSTYTVVFINTFAKNDETEINNSIADIFSQLLAQVAPVTTNTINVVINVTNEKVGPSNNNSGSNHHNVLVSCGDDNSCPHLFDKLRDILLKHDD